MHISIAYDFISRFDSRPLLFVFLFADLSMESSGAEALLPPNEGSEMDGKDHPADFLGAALAALRIIMGAAALLKAHALSLLSQSIWISSIPVSYAYNPLALPDLFLITGEGVFGLFIGMFTSIDSLLVESISLSEAIRAVRLCRTWFSIDSLILLAFEPVIKFSSLRIAVEQRLWQSVLTISPLCTFFLFVSTCRVVI